MIEKHFVLAGHAIFTLDIPQQFCDSNDLPSHYTYRVVKKEASDRWPEAFFVGLLTGPDNTSDYTYMGMLDPMSGKVRLTRASKMTEKSWPFRLLNRVLACLWAGQEDKIIEARFDLHHEGCCGRCGRMLTTSMSVKTGFGPHCRKILGMDVDEKELSVEEGQQVPYQSKTQEGKEGKKKRRRKAG